MSCIGTKTDPDNMVNKLSESEKAKADLLTMNNNNLRMLEFIVDPGTKTTYLKGKFLGKGGFARVHEMTDLTTNKVYAGKIIPKARLTKPAQKEKIVREIDLHRSLQHRHVVRFHHFFQDDENVYIILENCPRKSLVHVLKNRKCLSEPEVRHFMLHLCEGVQYIHGQGVVHRDLKLGNMLLSEDMQAKIGDFGLATRLQVQTTAPGEAGTPKKVTVCGTPNYIAPEVLNMKGHGFAADVWSMGCIMYAMLVGHPPFETPSLNETYVRITSNNYTIPGHVTEPAASLIGMMLHHNPAERPSIQDIVRHRFFTSGLLPKTLPSTCCITPPKFQNLIARSSPSEPEAPSTLDPKKVTHSMSTLRLNAQTKLEPPKVNLKTETSAPPKKEAKKESSFHSTLRQKLTSVLCPDKSRKIRGCSTAALYHMVLSCIDSMPDDSMHNPAPLTASGPPLFVLKWIDYSNKYGFGFQLSDHSVGVLFNDTSKISLAADRTRIEFHDLSGKCHIHSVSSVPAHLTERYTLLKYFTQYMDENLTEGGDLHQGESSCKGRKGGGSSGSSGTVPFMKRWVRTARAIIMQLSNGTLQINFFKDHTKIVLSCDRSECNSQVTYINEDRHSTSFSLEDVSRHGCDLAIRTRMQYALSVLSEFSELEGEDI